MNTSRTRAAALLLFLTALPCAHAARAQEAAPPIIIQTQTPAPQSTPAPTQAAAPATRNASGEKPAPTPAASEPITGRVVGEAGEPVPGVSVYAMSRAAIAGNSPFRTPRVAVADDNGNFKFTGLEPGLYQLNASLPAYVTESDPLTGRSGSTYRTGDTALLRLTKGGVVTGTVTDQQGEPLVALSVRAVRVRELDGSTPPSPFPATSEDRTDDRGVYRIYGLQPGFYVLYASGGTNPTTFGTVSAYGGEAPTFYPSGTRDTAAEVTVRAGQELAGLDIRYREEQGRRVTGTVDLGPAAATPPEYGVGVTLTYASTGMPAGGGGVLPTSAERSFSIEGISDGEYDLQATAGGREGLLAASVPQRVSVRGSDVTGLRVTLVPLASAAGTLVIEPAAEAERARAECKAARPSPRRPQETIITAVPFAAAAASRLFSRLDFPHDATPDEAGAFAVRSLAPGRYRLSVRLFDEALYVRAVQLPAAAPAAPATSSRASAAASSRAALAPAARESFDLKAGQQLSGIGVRLAEGAASFAGRVAPAEGAAAQSPAPTRVYLVPQERERADDPLRYYEAAVSPEGTFVFKNLAPGRYLVLARAEADAPDGAARRGVWDAATRTLLRREAEAANTTAELPPCQRTADFVLRFPQPSK